MMRQNRRKLTTSSRNRGEVVSHQVLLAAIDHWKNFFWFVGLCEGEACFLYNKAQASPRISISMTDEEPVARVAALFGISYWNPLKTNLAGKPVYRVELQGRRALQVMLRLEPYLCARRQAAIRNVIRRYQADRPHIVVQYEPIPSLKSVPYALVLYRSP